MKLFVLLFGKYYSDMYRMSEAEKWINDAMHFIFMGISFSVNIKAISLRAALSKQVKIEVVDPNTVDLGYGGSEYHKMTAAEYVSNKDFQNRHLSQ